MSSSEIEFKKIAKRLQIAFDTARQKFWESNSHDKSFAQNAGEHLAHEGMIMRDHLLEDLLIKETLIERKMNLPQICAELARKLRNLVIPRETSAYADLLHKTFQPYFLSWVKRAESAELEVKRLNQIIDNITIEKTKLIIDCDELQNELQLKTIALQQAIEIMETFPPGCETAFTIQDLTETYTKTIEYLKSILNDK